VLHTAGQPASGGDKQPEAANASSSGSSSEPRRGSKSVVDKNGVVRTFTGTWFGDRFVRDISTSKRPADVHVDFWAVLTPKEREKLLKERADAASSDGQSKSASSSGTASPAVQSESEDEVPLPSVFAGAAGRRHKISEHTFPLNACVARPVGAKEVARTPKAQAALKVEWQRLKDMVCWDETKVREWAQVSAESKRSGQKAHVGRVFAICVEKGSELPDGHPGKKFKGRVAFQGNDVKDENWDVALLQELSSCPATMEAAKAADCYGMFPGHSE
jgi:hypothetical protein